MLSRLPDYLWLRSPEIAIARVQERVRAGGHDVPEATIRRRYKRGVKNFFERYQELVATWAVYDHSVANSPVLMAGGEKEKEQKIVEENLWAEFCEVGK